MEHGTRVKLNEDWAEARALALKILAKADKRLAEERAREAAFLLGPWEDEGM